MRHRHRGLLPQSRPSAARVGRTAWRAAIDGCCWRHASVPPLPSTLGGKGRISRSCWRGWRARRPAPADPSLRSSWAQGTPLPGAAQGECLQDERRHDRNERRPALDEAAVRKRRSVLTSTSAAPTMHPQPKRTGARPSRPRRSDEHEPHDDPHREEQVVEALVERDGPHDRRVLRGCAARTAGTPSAARTAGSRARRTRRGRERPQRPRGPQGSTCRPFWRSRRAAARAPAMPLEHPVAVV